LLWRVGDQRIQNLIPGAQGNHPGLRALITVVRP